MVEKSFNNVYDIRKFYEIRELTRKERLFVGRAISEYSENRAFDHETFATERSEKRTGWGYVNNFVPGQRNLVLWRRDKLYGLSWLAALNSDKPEIAESLGYLYKCGYDLDMIWWDAKFMGEYLRIKRALCQKMYQKSIHYTFARIFGAVHKVAVGM